MKIKIKKKVRKFLVFIPLAFLLYVLYATINIVSYSNVNELIKADAAIVLGAGVWGDKPSPVFEERINHAIWLYKNGYVNKLIFAGGIGKGNDYSDSSIAKKYAIHNLVPEEDIYIEEQSTITQENIFYAAKIVDEHNMSTVIIVSDPLHMKRALLMAKDYGLEAYSSPTPTSAYRTLKSKVPFLAREVFFYIGYSMYRLFDVR